MTAETLSLPPNILGFWTRCLRTAQNWSQEALAATSGLDTRTIQRIESGKPASITTRRSLARGFGYDNRDIFDDPQFIRAVVDIVGHVQSHQAEEFHKQYPDHIVVVTSRVATGDALGRLAAFSNAYSFYCDDAVSLEAKRQASCIFDFLRDLGDISDEISFADKLTYNHELETMLRNLEQLGVWVYSASRSTKIISKNWADKSPMPITIGYLIVVPKDKAIEEMMVPKGFSFS